MREGQLWWFDNRQVHEARNDGKEERIHLIFDLLARDQTVEADAHEARTRRGALAATS